MTEPIPKWIMKSYSKLWSIFQEKEFSHKDASKILKKENMTSIILSELRKSNWLDASLHPDDSRKRLYKLKKPEDVIKQIARN